MLLDGARIGDIAVLSDGTQAVIKDKLKTASGNVYVTFDKEVTGWIGNTKYRQWTYHRDGSFVTIGGNGPHVDIVKVIHND